MKKSIYLFIAITLLSGFGMTAKAAIWQLATGDLSGTSAYANASFASGDIIELTDAAGSYTWTTNVSVMTKSLTIRAAAGLATRPVVTLSPGITFYASGNSVPYSLTFDGIDFFGNSVATSLTQAKSIPGGNLTVTMNNCIVRNFKTSTATDNIFNYLATGTGWTAQAQWYGDLNVTNSRFQIASNVYNVGTQYGAPNNTNFVNCYFAGMATNVLKNGMGATNTCASFKVDHCTFYDNFVTGFEYNVKATTGGTSLVTLQNSLFYFSSTTNVAANVVAVGLPATTTNHTNNAVYYLANASLALTTKYPTTKMSYVSNSQPTFDADFFVTTPYQTGYQNGGTDGKNLGFYNANVSITGTQTASTPGLLSSADMVTVESGGNLTIDANKIIQSLTIKRGGKVTLNNGNTLTVTNFNINSDASGTGTFVDANATSGLTVTGTTNVQQYLTGKTGTSTRANWYLSSPVSGATAAVFNVAAGTNKMTSYDETAHAYVTQFSSNSTALTPGKGYVTYIGGADATYTFSTSTGSNTAKLNSGGITVTPAPSRTGTSDAKRGFNLVGNPYPSFLDWKDVNNIKTNLRSTIWYRTLLLNSVNGTMTFDTYDGTTGTSNGANGVVTRYIPPMQAFWVKVDADGQTAELTFTNTARSHQDQSLANRLRVPSKNASEPAIVRLRVSNGTNADETILVADANATDALDTYDSEKMSTNNTAIPEIYTMAGSEELVINHLNDFAINKQVALGFRPGTNSTFSIVANELSNVDAQTKVILIDKLQNNAEFDLTNGSAYTFSADATPTTDRFVIAFRAPGVATNLSNTNTVNMFVYKNANNQIAINLNSTEEGIVTICNAIGQKLESTPTTGTTTVIRKSYGKGVYFVTVSVSGCKSTQKVILN